RSNLVTPGLRVSADPLPRINIMAAYRHFWLAEAKDSWGRTGLQDPTGNSGTYLGQHLQLRLRWDAVPGNVRVEAGAIFLAAENLSEKNTEYAYAGVTLTF
ncbi:MAG: alginate export family protein, partial [Pseudohongiellaceae bacterium]